MKYDFQVYIFSKKCWYQLTYWLFIFSSHLVKSTPCGTCYRSLNSKYCLYSKIIPFFPSLMGHVDPCMPSSHHITKYCTIRIHHTSIKSFPTGERCRTFSISCVHCNYCVYLDHLHCWVVCSDIYKVKLIWYNEVWNEKLAGTQLRIKPRSLDCRSSILTTNLV